MFMNPIEVKNHLEKKVWAIRKYYVEDLNQENVAHIFLVIVAVVLCKGITFNNSLK